MFAAEEYRTYMESGDKAIFESVVTLENSENNPQEYFKRLLLRRVYAATDFTEREAEVMLRLWGVMVAPQSVEEIGRELGVTRERIRQINATRYSIRIKAIVISCRCIQHMRNLQKLWNCYVLKT